MALPEKLNILRVLIVVNHHSMPLVSANIGPVSFMQNRIHFIEINSRSMRNMVINVQNFSTPDQAN